ncbi:MAG: DUF3857 domain-containing protein [Acidobacteria bacterium]|nr:DUF3857 domain-containing protein [Acidobacteriota bacterium]
MRSIASVGCVALFVFSGLASAVDWEPIDPALLSLQKPKIDPDADAEAVFWKVWLADKMQGDMPQTFEQHYVRLKIFTDRGVENHTTVDLASVRKTRIDTVRGRTIKPDGRIVELEKATVFERDVVKAGDVRVRMRSFSMPNVEVGDVIEYQWREVRDNSFANYKRLYFQRDIPSWLITYYVMPSQFAIQWGYTMRSQSFNCEHSGFNREPNGYFETHVENVPAFREEPYMPPEDQVRSWLLLYYAERGDEKPEKFWNSHGKELYSQYQKDMKPDGAVKKAAAEIMDASDSAEAKADKVLAFVHREIKDIYHDRSGISAEQRGNLKSNKGPGDTLEQKMGTAYDIMMLFGSLLQAGGVDARIAKLPRRDDRFFDPNFLNPYFLDGMAVAVPLGDSNWKFYDPASPYLGPGMLQWPEEGIEALVTDSKKPAWVRTGLTEPGGTLTHRSGEFTLLPDGTLEGKVTQTYSGHLGGNLKRIYDGLSEEERIERITDNLESRLSTAEVSEINIAHIDETGDQLSYSYKIRVPGYAVPTGKRLFLQPGFFERNRAALFTTSERRHDVYFTYGWSEKDHVTIQMPEGYELEDAEAPQSFKLGEFGEYTVKLAKTSTGKLIYDRMFVWGTGGTLLFPADAYPNLKGAFDAMHKQDEHMLTLRPAESAAGGR